IRTAFAGEQAGVVFEGERKFDLVVRLSERHRSDFNLSTLFVKTSHGTMIPVSELAEVKESVGPAQISRDDTKRRVTLGINVRGRDIESLVQEVQSALSQQLELPPGYYITYGGDFENLQQAKQRLMIAVPIALVLILVLLYFAFDSFRYALLIFVAVPLSAIGGIVALWLRDLPFSISAGVGFIALFGVAVLNGIVLISYFNELKAEGKWSLDEVIIKGGMVRLRPVIMTASVAALGFLPMALSETAGAEVQRPLATVVIGGLVSATLLTLVVLPVLYRGLERYAARKSAPRISPALIIGFLMISALPVDAQNESGLRLTEKDAVDLALKQNPQIKIADLEVESRKRQQKGSLQLPSTNIGFQYGQMNSSARDPYLEISQSLGSIPSHFQRARVNQLQIRVAKEEQALTQRELTFEVRNAWQEWIYLRQVVKELDHQLSFYGDFEKRADLQYRLGERSLLEKKLIENTLYELRNDYTLQSENLKQALSQLRFLIVTEDDILPVEDTLVSLVMPVDISSEGHPAIGILKEQLETRRAEAGFEKSMLFPEISVGYFRQTITETDIRLKGLEGLSVGIAIPLWFKPQQAGIQRSMIEQLQAGEELALGRSRLYNSQRKATSDAVKYQRVLAYFHEQGLEQASIIQRTATLQMDAGEIDFFQYLQSLQRYTQTRLQYLETLRNYNRSIIEVEYLSE
ncbi:MAG TPA: efflux RND transporter permease subunit, partial [Chryseosolibacter sp.]